MSRTEQHASPGKATSPVARVAHSAHFTDGYWTIRLERPERRNALDENFAGSLAQTFAELGRSAPGTPLVLCAAGSAFCAGADISFLKDVPAADRERTFADRSRTLTPALVRLIEAVQESTLVTIAAVRGAASGGGWALALACDFRIAAPEASFWFPEVEYGRPLSERSIALLLAHVGRARATEIVLAARRFGAAELHTLGLVNEVPAAEEVEERARGLALRLARFSAEGLATSKERIARLSRVA